jgi:hypothetical protein
MAAVRRNFRERKDILAQYNDEQLIERFRLDSAGIDFIVNLIGHEIASSSLRNHAVTPLLKVLFTLRFLATGKMQLCNGDDMGVSQSTVSRAITATLNCLTSPRVVAQWHSHPDNCSKRI